MIHLAIVAIVVMVVAWLLGPVICAATCVMIVHGGGKSNTLLEFTRGEFKRLGGFTTTGESVCRAAVYLQSSERFGKPLLLLPKTGDEVAWLRYRDIPLEIDGLDEHHHLAFEYDGPQHYSWPEWRKMGRRPNRSAAVLDYYRARFYDRWKTEMCRRHGVHLIRISTWTSFDAMRAVVKYALAHPFSEGRAVDDGAVIDALHEVDTRDSSYLTCLKFGTEKSNDFSSLTFASAEWSPHPYQTDSIYSKLFRAELHAFAEHVRGVLIASMPPGRAEQRRDVEQKICEWFDTKLSQVDAYSPQVEDARRALHGVATTVAASICL